MSSLAKVAIHSSQFPQNVRRDLMESLRTRRINHKFHYDSVNQTQKWLALHEAYSPSRTDPGCAAIYDRGFAVAVQNERVCRIAHSRRQRDQFLGMAQQIVRPHTQPRRQDLLDL